VLKIIINPSSSSSFIPETIKKSGSEYCLKSRTNKNLGCYPNKTGAQKREKQVNYFKHLDEAHHPSFCSENSNSNGFITPSGDYIPSKGKYHSELAFELSEKYEDVKNLVNDFSPYDLPEEMVKIGWVRISNAFTYDINKEKITPKQINTIFELIYSCHNAGKARVRIVDIFNTREFFINIAAIELEPKHFRTGYSFGDLFEKKTIKENLISSENINKFCDPKQTSFGFIYPDGEWDNAYEGSDMHSDIAAGIISDDMVKYSNIIKMLGFERLDRRKLWEKLKQTNQAYFLLVLEEGFIKVSNAFTYMINPDKISAQQRNKIVELVLSCRNAPENRLRIYDARTNSLFVDIKASEITDKIVARGSISQDFYESITKKFKKFIGSI